MAATTVESTALLNDTPSRDYSGKLRCFNAFAESEIRSAIKTLGLTPGMRILDVGCGSGEALRWFNDYTTSAGFVAGIDLAFAHVAAAREVSPPGVLVAQADLLRPPFRNELFDLIWCVNTINHLKDPVEGLTVLKALLRVDGRVAIGQSSFLPDMFFAWDSRFERVITKALRRFYRERYGLDERDVTHVRGIVGALKKSGFRNVTAQTLVVERVFPLSAKDEAYLTNVIFREASPARLKPYLSEEDLDQLTRLSDPADPDFAPRREDFHFLQTFTLAVGSV